MLSSVALSCCPRSNSDTAARSRRSSGRSRWASSAATGWGSSWSRRRSTAVDGPGVVAGSTGQSLFRNVVVVVADAVGIALPVAGKPHESPAAAATSGCCRPVAAAAVGSRSPVGSLADNH